MSASSRRFRRSHHSHAWRSCVLAVLFVGTCLVGGSASAELIDLGLSRPERLEGSGVVVSARREPLAPPGTPFSFELAVDGETGLLQRFAIDGVEVELTPFELFVSRNRERGLFVLDGATPFSAPAGFEFRLVAREGQSLAVSFAELVRQATVRDLTGSAADFRVVAVPEPSAAALLLVGLSCCGATLRCRRAPR